VAFAPAISPDSTTRPIFVFTSGDGGRAAIDRKITSRFAERGYGVIGINALKYFWRTRTPAEFADFINQVITRQAVGWEYSGIVVSGFSLGADVLSATLREAKPRVARNVVGMVLLNPSKFVEFEVHLTDRLSLGDSAVGRAIAPDLNALTVPVLCILGENEGEDSGCEKTSQKTIKLPDKPGLKDKPGLASSSRISILELPGGHNFDEDYGNVADRILTW